jgi:hypothetical protein
VLLIQVINISIDPVDPIAEKLGRLSWEEDLAINDIESIAEFLSEQFLGIDIPEQDEDDENGLVKFADLYITQSSIEIKKNADLFGNLFFHWKRSSPQLFLISLPRHRE